MVNVTVDRNLRVPMCDFVPGVCQTHYFGWCGVHLGLCLGQSSRSNSAGGWTSFMA